MKAAAQAKGSGTRPVSQGGKLHGADSVAAIRTARERVPALSVLLLGQFIGDSSSSPLPKRIIKRANHRSAAMAGSERTGDSEKAQTMPGACVPRRRVGGSDRCGREGYGGRVNAYADLRGRPARSLPPRPRREPSVLCRRYLSSFRNRSYVRRHIHGGLAGNSSSKEALLPRLSRISYDLQKARRLASRRRLCCVSSTAMPTPELPRVGRQIQLLHPPAKGTPVNARGQGNHHRMPPRCGCVVCRQMSYSSSSGSVLSNRQRLHVSARTN